MGIQFKIVPEGEGFYTIKDVPIFECHNNRGFECNEQWMNEAIQNFTVDRERGHRPTVIVGHNVKGIEKEAYGFLDNFNLRGRRLYADLCRIPRELKEKIIKNAFPSRSCEVLPTSKRILALALLGGTTPFFSLPQMVYEHDEPSYWSPIMSENQPAIDPKVAQQIAAEAVRAYAATQEQAVEEPNVYALTVAQAAEFIQDYGTESIFEAEDGEYYTQDESGDYYQIPQAVLYGAKEKGASSILNRFAPLTGGGGRASVRASKKKAAAAAAAAAHAPRGQAKRAFRKGKEGAIASHVAKHRGAYIAGGAGAAGVAAGAAGEHARNRYQIDDASGIVYFDGHPIGEVQMYGDGVNELPAANSGGQPDLVIEESAVGEDTGEEDAMKAQSGLGTNNFVEPHNREDSDQFQQLGEGLDYVMQNDEAQQGQMYQLQHEVQQLRYANELHQVARKAETYKAYLLQAKRSGAPVGNIEQQVDFMLSLDDKQAQKYMAQLESAPKVSLGQMAGVRATYDGKEKAKAEFNQNIEQYQKMGVTPSDLDYAQYVRTNAFTNQSQNGNPVGEM